MQANRSGIEICFGHPAVQYLHAVHGMRCFELKMSHTLSIASSSY